nr:14203_t:CDS:10 [Entrophospora candida]
MSSLCGSGDWGPGSDDGLDLQPCAREVILNAIIPIGFIVISITDLLCRLACSRTGSPRSSRYHYNQLSTIHERGYIPVSKYDIGQFVISFFHLGFVSFLVGWRFDEYDENNDYGLYWVIGAAGQFVSWFYIAALIGCHFMTRKNQTQYAYLRHLLIFYTLFLIVACINLRSMIRKGIDVKKGYEMVFAIWDVIACTLLFCFSLKRPRNPQLKPAVKNREVSHDTTASLWSLLTFAWMAPMIKLGNTRVLNEKDLWELPFKCQATKCYNELEGISNVGLFSRLILANARNLVMFLIIAILRSMLAFTTPFFLQQLLRTLLDPTNPLDEKPFLYAFGILVSELSRIIFLNQLNYQVVWLGIRVEQMLSVSVYEKQLRLKTNARNGSVRPSNLITTDVDQISGFFSNLPFVLTIILEIVLAIVYLYVLLGNSGFIGILVMAICLYWSNKRFSRRVTVSQKRVKKARDDRVNKTFEFLHAIRIIKMFAWEDIFYKKLMSSRENELNQLGRFFWRTTFHTLHIHVTPFLVTLFAFGFYTYFGHELTADIAFTSITLFNILKQPMQILPNLLIEFVGFSVAVSKVEKFLYEIEIKREISPSISDHDRTVLGIYDANISWSLDPSTRGSNAFTLKGVNLEFPVGKLSVICGSRSSGKTMLILSLLRETFITRGSIQFPAKPIAYVPQQPWLKSSSIRDNIVFGEAFDVDKYWHIVDACCLTEVFGSLKEADSTEYDEKNLILTDSQKARITLARALYSSAQYLLIDDFLSSIEFDIAQKIIENCLKGSYVSGKTVILVTQYVKNFLDTATYVAILGESTVLAKGSPEEVRASEFLTEEILDKDIKSDSTKKGKGEQNLLNQVTEARSQGKIPARVYRFYMKSSGGFFIWLILVLFFITVRFLTVCETYWLKVWSDVYEKDNITTTIVQFSYNNPKFSKYHILVYGLIALASALFTIFRTSWQSFISLKGSRNIFKKLLNSILRAPLSFFDAISLGKIINRFSKDLGVLDQGLITVISSFLGNSVGALSVLVVVSVVVQEFIFVSFVVVVLYFYVVIKYINVSRELKRLHSVTRSPVVSWFNETVTGVVTIRAFSSERDFSRKFISRLNTSNRTTYLLHMSNRWMSIRLGIIGAIASYLAAIFILWDIERINAGLAGFCMTYALGFVQIVFMLVKDYSTMETGFSSVERIEEYTRLPQEPLSTINSSNLPAAWPTDGYIEVSNLTVKYSQDAVPVLHDVSFVVNPGEKIAIVGRPNSGKTTLVNSFLRLTDTVDGSIIIDDINIANIGSKGLRTQLTIISKDPVLFEGTIRSNLDIGEVYNDDYELWDVLKRVHLSQIESDSTSNPLLNIGPITSLEDPVIDGGSTFSKGQRQLICFARALLRRSKIIILDEATANVDPDTDDKIQKIIQNEFKYNTVLCVSNQYKNIINFDKIFVLDEGRMVEFDTPDQLLNNPNSVFRQLCEQKGELETLMDLVAGLAKQNDVVNEEHVDNKGDDEIKNYDDDGDDEMNIEDEDTIGNDEEPPENDDDESQENNEIHEEQLKLLNLQLNKIHYPVNSTSDN